MSGRFMIVFVGALLALAVAPMALKFVGPKSAAA